MNTNMFIVNGSKTWPNRIALSADDTDITYAQLCQQVSRLTNALRTLGIGKDSRVGFLDRNCAETVVTYFAVSRLCAVFAPLNYDTSIEELYEMIDTLDLDAIFIGDEHLGIVQGLKKRFPKIGHIISIRRKIYGLLDYRQLIREGSAEYFIEPTEGNEINAILFTSGVGGKPKAVALGHDNFIDLALSHCCNDDKSANEGFLLNVPLYHISGFSSIMPHLHRGGRLILMKYFFSGDWIVLVDEEKVGRAFLPPSFLSEILGSSLLPKTDLSSLHTVVYGGDSVSADIITDAVDKFPPHIKLVGNYGLTETTMDAARLAPEDHRPAEGGGPGHVGSIGKAVPGVKVAVADAGGNRLGPNEIGELLVHTSRPMKGYVDPKSHHVIPFSDYWICTGDLGYIDDNGYIFLKGQKMDSSIEFGGERPDIADCSISVYPARYSEQNTDYQEAQILERSSVHISELYRIMKSMQKCHESLDVNEIINSYMCTIPDILQASAYGIHLVPQNDMDNLGYEYSNRIHKWKRPRFDALPVTSVISDSHGNTKGTKYNSFIESISLKEFSRRTQPGQWIRTPMYTPTHDLLGVLSFVKTDKSDSFTPYEQSLMRLVAGNMCNAFVNAMRYFKLSERQRVTEHIIKTFGCPIIVSEENGRLLYMNEYVPELLEAKPDLVSEMNNSIKELICGKQPTITKLMQITIRGKEKWFKLKTVSVPEIDKDEVQFYVTAIFTDSDTLDFECFSDTLNQREIDVLTLVSQGLYNAEISEKLCVSVDTVKFYLKSLFQKFNVSTRTELVIQVYNMYGSKYPYFSFLI